MRASQTVVLLLSLTTAGCFGTRLGIVSKTALAVTASACAGLAIAANTQISDERVKSYNQSWGYAGVTAGVASSIVALVALIASKEPGTNWWDSSGWAIVTGIAAGAASIAGITAIVRYGSMYSAGGSGPQCIKGCPCGNTCIDCSKTCHL